MTTKKSVYDVLRDVQNAIGVRKKHRASKYSYRSASDILAMLPELRAEFNFVVIHQEEIIMNEGNLITCKSIVTFKSLAHEETIPFFGFAIVDLSNKLMSTQQSTRAGFSFALKGALENTFSLTEREDLKYEEESNKREEVAKKLATQPATTDYIFKTGTFQGRRLSSIKKPEELLELKRSFEQYGRFIKDPNTRKQISDYLAANIKGVTI